MCELYKIDPVLDKIKGKLNGTYETYNGKSEKYRNFNFLTLETTFWNKAERERFCNFQKEMSHIGSDNKKNNKYYRTSFEYRCIVDVRSFNKIIERLNYCVINSVEAELKMITSNIDKMFFIVSHIIQNSIDKTKENRYNKDNHIAMAKNFLEYFIQRESSDLLAYMIHIGIIDGDLNTYNTGTYTGKCRTYWLVDPPSKEFIVYPITDRPMVNKRFSEKQEEIFEEKKKKNSLERNMKADAKGVIDNAELHEYFNENIDFNIEKGYKFLHENLNVNPISFANYINKQRSDDNFKLHKIGRDLFGNRFYHPFCNFPKQLRQFIQINGSEDTDIIDISNSQPYFFTQLLNISFLKYIRTNTDILSDDEYGLILSYAIDTDNKKVIKALNDLVSKGMYYDYISSELNTTRGEAKQQNMYLFFSEGLNKIAIKLKHEFKLLIEVRNKISKVNKNRFAEILQQVESHFIVDKIFYALKDMGINTIPIHDAFIVKKEDVEVVEIYIHNLSIQMGMPTIPFTTVEDKFKIKDNSAVVDKFKDRFRVIRELSQKKEFNAYLMDNFTIEKMNYMVQLMGEKRAKFGKHRKGEKLQELLDRVVEYQFSEEQELLFESFERSLLFVEKMVKDNYDFYVKSEKTFKNYTQSNGYRFVRDERITPVDFINDTFGTDFKNRVNWNKYNYNKLVEA